VGQADLHANGDKSPKTLNESECIGTIERYTELKMIIECGLDNGI
jgi:hypothetical protein